MKRFLYAFLVLAAVGAGAATIALRFPHILPPIVGDRLSHQENINTIRARVAPDLDAKFQGMGLNLGDPIFLRIFKEEQELELWVQAGAEYQLFKTYPICNHSGELGPKLREGDRQSPEGIYLVDRGALNPNSRFHLSFNLGFPNAFDRANDRTGSFLMVHGDCVSIGCYAMTDPGIEEIYIAAEAALRSGQGAFAVHAFPFRMSDDRMAQVATHRWGQFWQDLKPIYDAFENTKLVPSVSIENQRYALKQ